MQYKELSQCRPAFEQFCERYECLFRHGQQRPHFRSYLLGLLSSLERKSIEPIALEQEIDVRTLQHFIGASPWDDRLVLVEHRQHVRETLGSSNGIFILDPTAFPKRGEHSVGVARQWCGQLGKQENCQVAVNLTYASEGGHTFLDRRLYLPDSWASDVEVRQASKGPIRVSALAVRVRFYRGPKKARPEGWLLIADTLDQRRQRKVFQSNARPDCSLASLLSAAYARWPIEQDHGQGKNETGLGDYETRTWLGWHRHTALSFLAHHSNAGLGIDLDGTGVTNNDTGDGDTGPNNLQNFPVLTQAVAGGNTVSGTLNSAANTAFRVEFFSNSAADPTGFGEGQTFIGATTVTTDGSGNVSFTASVPVSAGPDGQINGGGGVDKFRIKIWDKGTGGVVYDNQMGGDDDADATDAIEGGSIVIHNGGAAKPVSLAKVAEGEAGEEAPAVPEAFGVDRTVPTPSTRPRPSGMPCLKQPT